MSTRWIDVRYKCSCMLVEATINVVERKTGEDVRDFMARVQSAIGDDHHQRSPFCASQTMEYAKVPVEGDVVGGGRGGTA